MFSSSPPLNSLSFRYGIPMEKIHTHARTHGHTRARARAHTHTHTRTHARAHTHTHTHILRSTIAQSALGSRSCDCTSQNCCQLCTFMWITADFKLHWSKNYDYARKKHLSCADWMRVYITFWTLCRHCCATWKMLQTCYKTGFILRWLYTFIMRFSLWILKALLKR